MVDININLDIEGDISDEDLDIRLKILAELIVNAIKQNIRDMGLIQGGQYLQGWVTEVKDGGIVIENTIEHSDYLEFGTFGYWEKHGLDSFTDPSDPKKKDISPSQRLKFPKGMQAFAPVRKVLFNDSIMQGLVDEAFS
jgi:hypothetical protein